MSCVFVPHVHTQVALYIGFTEMCLILLQTEGRATTGDTVTRCCVFSICNWPSCLSWKQTCFDRKCKATFFWKDNNHVFEKLLRVLLFGGHFEINSVTRRPCQSNCYCVSMYTVKNGLLLQHNHVLLLGHVSIIVSILLSKLSDCPNTNTLLCYCNDPFLTE